MDGIIILALKKSAYYQAAANLAMSIKHYNKSIHITLVSDGGHNEHYRAEHYSYFDWIKQIGFNDYNDENGFSPALAKINIYKYSEYDNTLYIDSDTLVLQDLQPLLDKLNDLGGLFYSNVLGSGGYEDNIHYQAWATNEKLWEYFGLKKDQIVYTFNSSWIYFKKESKGIFQRVYNNYVRGFDKKDLKNKWGNTLPDELFFYGTLAQLEINPTASMDVCFFGEKVDERDLDELQDYFYMFTLYGGRSTVRLIYREWYDRLCFMMCRENGLEHYFKSNGILQGKHVIEK